MKQRNSILILIIVCCLCLALMTGCKPDNPQPTQPKLYNITIDENIEHGSVQCDLTSAKAGDTVTVVAEADKDYQLVAITVNGEAISGNSFVMPEADVVISATFGLTAGLLEAVPEGAIKIVAQSAGGASAKGHVFMTFGAEGLTFEAYVEDASVVERDGVAILFSRELPVLGGHLSDGKTIRIAVNAKGVASMSATDAEGVLQAATLEGVTTDFATWSKNGEKLDGYHVEIYVPYAVLGTTAEAAKGAFTVCPVVYSAYGSLPASSASLEGVQEDAHNTFAVLTDDNTVRDNKYNMLSAQLGSFGALNQGIYWDLSKDYYAEDAENYPNREALLLGHDGNDNNVVFYRVSANEMYVRATLTVTGVSNPNDQWPKFGLMLFDGASKKGVFFYVDAIMSGAAGNTMDNIVGTDVGYNIAPGTDFGAWVTAKGGVFNLTSKSIVMEMVYQDGWVHMYADGQHIKTVYYGSYNENLRFGIKSFGIDLKVTDYMTSTDAEADGWADKKQTAPDAKAVDILFAGDSYMDFWNSRHITNQLSYTDATHANIGVGGTKVQYWIDKAPELSLLYTPAKIAFHIGVNDIDDAGADPADVLANLKVMFEKYHEIFPDATIYWNSLIPNTMFPDKYADYKVINAGVLEYASDKAWLVYIDQTTVFDANGAARQDVFDDGLHLSVDIGYPIWANVMLTAMGYERPDGTVMGDIDRFAHTGLWEFREDGSAYSWGNWDTALWFKNISGENVYLEAVISATALRNGDGYPKFGLLVRNDHESRWGFIDAVGFNQANTSAGLVYRGVNGISQSAWDWNSTVWGGATGCDFGNVKLAIAKLGDTVYFLVNDTIYCTSTLAGDVVVGFESFNLEVLIKDVVSTTDVAEIERKLGLRCQDAEIDGEANDSIWTEEVLANTQKFGDKGDGRYFTVAAVKGSDGVYFLVNTYTFENTRSSTNWWDNANIEFRFGNNLDAQQYIYVDGVGFNAVRSTAGIPLAAIKSNGNEGNIYHTTFEFFAPYNSFPGYDANSEEIALKVWGWVWDSEGWNHIMNIGGYPNLTVSAHGLRYERNISVSGTNAAVSVDVQNTARKGDSVVAAINVAEGQKLAYVKVNGVEHEVVEGKVTFTMPDGDVAIEVALEGIGVTSNVIDHSGEGLNATVNCEAATAVVGETITFTVDKAAASKIVVKVNGEAVEAVEGVYSYTVKATDTGVVISIEIDYDLSEAIDGVKGEGYGTPISFKVEGGRSVTVWAKTDDNGVYFYVEANTNGVVVDGAEWWQNHNFEFYLNNGEQSYVNARGESKGASKSVYNYAQQESGKYLHTVEIYVNKGHISGFDPESVALNYAFKAPGEAARYEYMINNQWDRTDWWRTSHSTPSRPNLEHVGLGTVGVPECIHITKNGIVHDCERANIDADLGEYAGKNAFLGQGNDNAKFDFTGYVAEDGVYLGITIYQNSLSESVADWWLNDNLEIKLLGDRAGFSLIDDFIAGCGPLSDYALVRTDGGDSGFAYKTVVELFYEYDFSTAKQATFQVGVNGNGFGGWQSLMWDGNVPYINENGIEWISLFVDWPTAQLHVAEKMAAGEGIVLDGKADEALYAGLTSITFDNVNGAKMVVTGRKLSTGIIVLNTITHTRPATDVIQGSANDWWGLLDVEYRMGGNYTTQMAASVLNNGDWDQYCASKAVTVDNGDGTYITTFETFLPFTTEYGGMDYDGEVQVCIGGVFETGFTWVRGCGPDTPIYANEDGFILR
ncbi:MAG: hypothetical protein IKA84_03015 [Clostridia bacterium]|nr:hypothetical protein [Clostridia bacterium]